MNILHTDTNIGLIWYTAKDWLYRTVHVVCYGLEVKQFNKAEDAQSHIAACQRHHWEAEGIFDDDEIKALSNR